MPNEGKEEFVLSAIEFRKTKTLIHKNDSMNLCAGPKQTSQGQCSKSLCLMTIATWNHSFPSRTGQ